MKADVDLLEDPVFEERNCIISTDGEPIDPFHLQIKLNDNNNIQRKILDTKRLCDMIPAERRCTNYRWAIERVYLSSRDFFCVL